MSSSTSSLSFRRPFKIYFSFVLEGNIRCRVPLFKPTYKIYRQKNTDGLWHGKLSITLLLKTAILLSGFESCFSEQRKSTRCKQNSISRDSSVRCFFTIQYYAEGRISIWVYRPFILVENDTCSARRHKFWKHLYCIACLEKRSWVFLSYFPYKPTCYKKNLNINS